MYYNLHVCFSVNEYFGYFQLFSTIDSAVTNIAVRVS